MIGQAKTFRTLLFESGMWGCPAGYCGLGLYTTQPVILRGFEVAKRQQPGLCSEQNSWSVFWNLTKTVWWS